MKVHWERALSRPVEDAGWGKDRRTGRFIDRWPTWNWRTTNADSFVSRRTAEKQSPNSKWSEFNCKLVQSVRRPGASGVAWCLPAIFKSILVFFFCFGCLPFSRWYQSSATQSGVPSRFSRLLLTLDINITDWLQYLKDISPILTHGVSVNISAWFQTFEHFAHSSLTPTSIRTSRFQTNQVGIFANFALSIDFWWFLRNAVELLCDSFDTVWKLATMFLLSRWFINNVTESVRISQPSSNVKEFFL